MKTILSIQFKHKFHMGTQKNCLIEMFFFEYPQDKLEHIRWRTIANPHALDEIFFFFFFFVVNDTPSISEDYLPCARKVFTQHD